MSDADRWAVVERIYNEAVERPVADRSAFLESACAGDATLRRELESLLANDGASLLDKSALEVAAREMAQHVTPSWLGRTVRNYEILALLGVGGMGEVYRARDRSLGREVALKFLPREVSKDPERLRRLEREARMLAALNHPSIATLYGLEEHDGQRFLVMEIVPGQTLAERLGHGALPIREALDVSRQIAEGLEAAHDAGIIHRDLKPANVKITPDGRVKLLDFGLAKALDTPESGIDPTVPASEATREGTVLGTPAYMSPEQARGHMVDRRTDIWAFGCCLYECLSGRSAFRRNTITETLAAILEHDPDWSALGGSVPLVARRLVRRCLAKDVRRRLQHIGDARVELEDTDPGADQPPTRGRRIVRALPALAGAALLIAVGAGLISWLDGRRTAASANHPVALLTLRLEGATVSDLYLPVFSWFIPFAISPDGERLVLRASGGKRPSQLYLRELAGLEWKALPGTDAATAPVFSPDGRWIAFWRAEDRILRKVSTAGGAPIEIGPTDIPSIALWGANDEIVFDTGFSKADLWSIPAAGRTPQPIVVQDRVDDEDISLRAVIPGGTDLLVASTRSGTTWLDVLSRETGKRRRLVRGGSSFPARYTRTGHLVYADADALFAVPMNGRLEPLGPPAQVMNGIDHYFWHSNVALSENGTVVYLSADRVREAELIWFDRKGNVTPVPGGRGPFQSVALSPGGREAAGDLVSGTHTQVWIFDLERGSRRLLVPEGESRQPIWSRDGAFITYVSHRGGDVAIARKRADGTGSEEFLVRRPRTWLTPNDWSPDGGTLLFSEYTSRGDSDVSIYSAGRVLPLLAGPANEADATFSPDGRFIAFSADDGGVGHVYVQPFPGPGPRTTISIDEGGYPRWGADARQLLYQSRGRMMVVAVQTHPVLRVGEPQVLIERGDPGVGFTIARDGRRFLTYSPRGTEGPIELRVVVNWFEELERLAPHPRQ